MNPGAWLPRWLLLRSALWVAVSLNSVVSSAELTIRTTSITDASPLPARIHLLSPEGKAVRPSNGLPFWFDHVSSPGSAEFRLDAGRYTYQIERGPEWSRESGVVEIAPGQDRAGIKVPLTRLVDLASDGWWSGEMHIHRPLDQVELLMRAEELHFGQLITWWNAVNPWTSSPLPKPEGRAFDGHRYVQVLGGEDERDGGALLFCGMKEPLNITSGTRHFPSSLAYALEARKAAAWIDIEKPFWWDVPMWIAHGIGDSIGIANNHMHRGGVMGNEAWGRSRDLIQYPGAHGNGRWTQEIYYHLLNCGIRLPPSAGSASGVLPNPVGYNRVYVQIDDEPSWEKWWAGLRAGRVFVSNGPLLRVKANGQLPGHVFRTDQESLDVRLETRLDSPDPIERLEIVRNGRAEEIPFPARVTFQESGWFLIRAITAQTQTFRFASTGPFYVELRGKPQNPRQGESAAFFLKWSDERLATLASNPQLSSGQKESVLEPWKETRTFWQGKAQDALARSELTGQVVDDVTGQLLAARVYLRDGSGGWFFVESTDPMGSAIRYEKRNRAMQFTLVTSDPSQGVELQRCALEGPPERRARRDHWVRPAATGC